MDFPDEPLFSMTSVLVTEKDASFVLDNFRHLSSTFAVGSKFFYGCNIGIDYVVVENRFI